MDFYIFTSPIYLRHDFAKLCLIEKKTERFPYFQLIKQKISVERCELLRKVG